MKKRKVVRSVFTLLLTFVVLSVFSFPESARFETLRLARTVYADDTDDAGKTDTSEDETESSGNEESSGEEPKGTPNGGEESSNGEPEGEIEGDPEGESEGEPEGDPEGEPEGDPEGELEGEPESELEGEPEGDDGEGPPAVYSTRDLLFDLLFGSGYQHADPQAQAAVEAFVRSDTDEAFLLWLCDLIGRSNEPPSFWAEYLLQAIGYEWPVNEPGGADYGPIGIEAENAFLLSIGMNPLRTVSSAIGGFSTMNKAYTEAGVFLDDSLASSHVADDITADSLIRSFTKSARPVEDAFRSYEIAMDFKVGATSYTIPGHSEAVDVVFLIDKTNSMDQEVSFNGINMSRINVVKTITKSLVQDIMDANEDNRVGVVAFKNIGENTIELTPRGGTIDDYEVYSEILWDNYYSGTAPSDRNVYGFEVPDYAGAPSLYYRNGNTYIPAKANAVVKVLDRPIGNTYYHFEQVSSNGTHFVPYFTSLKSTNKITIYAAVDIYQGVYDVCYAIDNMISSGGNTNIQHAIRSGYAMLNRGGGNRKQVLILLTDGEANTYDASDKVWDRVVVANGILPSQERIANNASMLEGQWTVEQGVALYAIGFGTDNSSLQHTTWAMSPSGSEYLNVSQKETADSLPEFHTGYEQGNRYFSTFNANELALIFNEIRDQIIPVGSIEQTVLTDELSETVQKSFNLDALKNNATSAITVTGFAANGNTLNPDYTAVYNDKNGILEITFTQPLPTGEYRVSFIITALADQFAENNDEGLRVATNDKTKINYTYYKPDEHTGCHVIKKSPVVDIPPLLSINLAGESIEYVGSAASLTANLNMPDISGYLIPDTWKAYYGSHIQTSAVFTLNGEVVKGLHEGAVKIPVTLKQDKNEFRLSGQYATADANRYPLIHGGDAVVILLGVEGKLTYTLSSESDGLFDVMTQYDGGKQFSAALMPGDWREYTVRSDLNTVAAFTYAPYGYKTTTVITGKTQGCSTINLAEAIQKSAGSEEAAIQMLKSQNDKDIQALLQNVKQHLSLNVDAEVDKIKMPWFRDWAWFKKENPGESEVRSP